MGVLHRASQCHHELSGLLGRDGRAVELLGQATSTYILQGQNGAAVMVTNFINLHDVSIIKVGDGFGFGSGSATLRGWL